MQNYDVTIKAHPKDYYKLSHVISSLKHLKPEFDNIYIISPDAYVPESIFSDKIIPIKDDDVVPFIDKTRFNYRYNWCWANMVSITQEFTNNDLYLDVQADNFFLNDIELFAEDGRPRLFKTKINSNNNNVWPEYFNFSKNMFGIDKVTVGSSYIIEFIMYDKNKLKSLFSPYDKHLMIEKSYNEVSAGSYPADQEIYGNLIESRFPDSYEIVDPVETYLGGDRTQDNNIERVLNYISDIRKNYPNAIAYSHHTWWSPEWK